MQHFIAQTLKNDGESVVVLNNPKICLINDPPIYPFPFSVQIPRPSIRCYLVLIKHSKWKVLVGYVI